MTHIQSIASELTPVARALRRGHNQKRKPGEVMEVAAMALVPMVTGFLSLLCAAWTLLSDLAVAAYSPGIRVAGLVCALITSFLLVSSIRKENPGPGNRPGWWSSKLGRFGLFLLMVAFSLMLAHILGVHHVSLDVVSHVAGVATAILLFTWAVLRRRRSRPTTT